MRRVPLFDPIVATERLHPNFRSLLRGDNPFNLEVLNSWADGFVDRDVKFVEEFQTTFNSGFWELYIFAVLKEYGIPVDFSHASPDFCIPSLGLNIEATIASNSPGAQPEHIWPQNFEPEDSINEFNRKTILRLSNSLTAKHLRYLQSYALLEHVKGKAFVVAVTNFDQPLSFLACQRPIEAVLHGYYIDEERYLAAGGEGPLETEELLRVFKENGSPVELGLFRTPAYKEISAVIFNGCATIGKVRALSADPNPHIMFTALRSNPHSNRPHVIQQPKRSYKENLLDGLRIYHNPFATYPLDPDLFRHPSVFQLYFTQGEMWAEQHEGDLICRFVQTGVPPGSLQQMKLNPGN